MIISGEENLFLRCDEEVEKREVTGRMATWIGDIFLTMKILEL